MTMEISMKHKTFLLAGLALSCCLATSGEVCGQAYREGAYYNPYNGASAAARSGYNCYTGRDAQESTRYNPYTNRDVSEKTVTNPYTGRSYAERSVSNPYTGRSTESYAYRRR
jgi:hypothetical protein